MTQLVGKRPIGRFNRPSALWLAAAAVCLFATSGTAIAADEEGNDDRKSAAPAPVALSWTLESSHSALGSGGADFYVRLRIKAAKVKTERPPLTLALVFDRSGSMKSDDRIGFVRKAGYLVTENLTRVDYVAIVAFKHEVQTIVPLHPVVNHEYLRHRIDELHAEGYTNISGGLLEGVAEVRKRPDSPGPHHVILLTDGVANRGVWQPDALVALTGRVANNGVTVTTIGVGTEYNESLLTRMALAGGGRFVHVAKPEDIPAALKQEMGALLAVVAQNVKLKLKLPAGVEVVQVFGWERSQKPGQLELPLGDFTSGEERVVLAKMRLKTRPAEAAGKPLDFPAALTFDDVAAAERVLTEKNIAISWTNGSAKETPIMAYARLVEAVDTIALAVTGMDRKAATKVLQIQRTQYPELKRIAWASRDQDFVNKAFMFEHYARELHELIDHGALHEHSQERARLQKELHYRRYLMQHHQHQHNH